MNCPLTVNPLILQTFPSGKPSTNLTISLKIICLKNIALNWQITLILQELSEEDKVLLIELLPENLPLSVTIPNIDNNLFWKKCYLQKWGDFVPKVTKTIFLEKYLSNYLQSLKLNNYNSEELKELCQLSSKYIQTLKIKQLQFSPKRLQLGSVLSELQNITHFSLCFKQTYTEKINDFSWDSLLTTFDDIKSLSRGLSKLRLQVFELINSDITDDKLIIILKPLLKHSNLKILNLSHCKLKDLNVLSRYLLETSCPSEKLLLTNNKIEASSMKFLGFALTKSPLKELDLSLNKIGTSGAQILLKTITSTSLQTVHLQACNLTKFPYKFLQEHNSPIIHLNMSNNTLDQDFTWKLVQILQQNPSNLQRIDMVMCGLPSDTQLLLQNCLDHNKKTNPQTRHEDDFKIKDLPADMVQLFQETECLLIN